MCSPESTNKKDAVYLNIRTYLKGTKTKKKRQKNFFKPEKVHLTKTLHTAKNICMTLNLHIKICMTVYVLKLRFSQNGKIYSRTTQCIL
jgi:hypothetical protein